MRDRLRAMRLDTTPLRESRDFRLLFIAGTVFYLGGMVSYVAVPYQLYQLTGSNFAVGALGIAELVPLLVFGLYGGALSFPMPFFPQRALAVRGSYVGTLDELRELIALGQEGRIPPIPLDLRPLDAAPQALADLRAGRVRGRVILKPGA